MVFFYFFDHENLESELKDFVVDPRLKRIAEKASLQRDDFVSRYPLGRLGQLSADELWSKEQRSDDFIHWVTDKTRGVTNQLPWAKYNLELHNSYSKKKVRPFSWN